MFVTSADLPIDGRAASTIRLPGWKPPVRSSRSLKPDGVPVSEMPWRDTSSSLSSSSWSTSSIGAQLARAVLVGDPEELGLGLLHQLVASPREREDVAPATSRVVVEQAAQQRVLLDDPGVVADVARPRAPCSASEWMYAGPPASSSSPARVELVGHRDGVDRLGIGLLLQPPHRAEDRAGGAAR